MLTLKARKSRHNSLALGTHPPGPLVDEQSRVTWAPFATASGKFASAISATYLWRVLNINAVLRVGD